MDPLEPIAKYARDPVDEAWNIEIDQQTLIEVEQLDVRDHLRLMHR